MAVLSTADVQSRVVHLDRTDPQRILEKFEPTRRVNRQNISKFVTWLS